MVIGCIELVLICIYGDGLVGEVVVCFGDDVIEVVVVVEFLVVGEWWIVWVYIFDGLSLVFEFIVVEFGWMMFMISYFYYDLVWWNI